jgi:hypothetical protein
MVEEAVKSYRVAYKRDESGWWVATVRGVRGCHTQGRTVDEAARGYTQYGPLKSDTGEAVVALLQPIQARVIGIVQGIRAEANYALIFDMDGQSSSVFLAVDPSLDVTAKVIDRLKQPK